MRGIDIKRIGVGLAAVAFVLTASLGMVANVAAEDEIDYCDTGSSNYNSLMCDLVGADGVPEGLSMVVEVASDDTGLGDDKFNSLFFGGEDKWNTYRAFVEKIENGEIIPGESNEFKMALVETYDKIGMYPMLGELIDFHLVNSRGDEVEYDGDEITIHYRFTSSNPAEGEEYDIFTSFSAYEWRPAVMHIDDDLNREFLPASVSDDGVWTFATDDFSMFMPVMVPVEEEEAPKTADDSVINICAAAMSICALIALGVWIKKEARL